ncbi:MAG: c-type cytochrome [Thermoleophilia bacterium]
MTNRNAFFIFFVGTAISLAIFLWLTVETHRQVGALTHAENLSDQVVAGKRVWEKKNCNECHTILGFGIYYAPDLTRVYKRIGPEGIKSAVMNPEVTFASSIRKMQNLGVTEQENADLTAFLEWVGNIDNHDWPPQDSEEAMSASQRRLAGAGLSRGASAYKENCIRCHSLGGSGGSGGPALDSVGDKYDADTISRLIADPTSVQPGSRMMALPGINESDRQAIGEFLAKQGGGQ